MHGPRLALLAATLLASSPLAAQEIQGFPAAPSAASAPPGRFHLGPFYITPTLRIGTIGLDTNVFYTQTDRQTDATANGGPGLEIVLPFAGAFRLFTGGGVNYVYFLRTESQRRFAGDAKAGLAYDGNRMQAEVRETFTRSFQRPSFEVDRRVLQDQLQTSGDLKIRTVGRLGLHTALGTQRSEVTSGQEFAGTDLHATLSRNEHQAVLGLRYALTPKTSLLVEGDYVIDRFLVDKARDADSNRVYGGLQIESETRLSGRAVAGERFFRFRDRSPAGIQAPYALVDLWYRFGPRTRLNATYGRDLAYSAFNTSGATPTLRQEAFGARLEKGLVGRMEIFFFGRETRFRTDGSITVQTQGGGLVTAVRDDTAREAGADLGYRFPSSLRIGVAAVYTNRRSTIADFGIKGLLVGGTVTYDPKRR